MNSLLESYYGPKSAVLPILYEANLLVEKQRHLLRLCFELRYFNVKKYELA